MPQYHENQEVMVSSYAPEGRTEHHWRQAKVVRWIQARRMRGLCSNGLEHFEIEFSDRTRAVFDSAHIRAAIGDK